MHVELRTRTVCELACHEKYYLRPEIVVFCGGFTEENNSKNAGLHATSATLEKASYQGVPEGSYRAQETFILDCLETATLSTYCNMWLVYALSTVQFNPSIQILMPAFDHFLIK